MMQMDYNLTTYQIDRKVTSLNWDGQKSYLMFKGTETLVQVNSNDAYASDVDSQGNYKQYHFHGRISKGFSSDSDYLEGFDRNNPTKIYDNSYHEVEIAPQWFLTDEFEEYNYVDLKWLLIFPSPTNIQRPIKAAHYCGMPMTRTWKILDFTFRIR